MARDSHPTRRRLIAAGVAGIAGLAGCAGGQQGTPTTAEPTSGGRSTTAGGGGGMETTAAGTETTSGGGQTASSGRIQPGDTGNEVRMLTDYTSSAWQDIWENELIPAVDEEFGIEFVAEYAGMAGTGSERLVTLLQSGQPPESFTGGVDTEGNASLAGDGRLAATNHIIDRITDNVGDLIGEPAVYGGNNLVVPHGLYTLPMMWRKDVLDELGLEPPTTLEERLHNARTIDESDEFDIRGDSVAAQKAGKSQEEFLQTLRAHGAYLFRWKTDERNETEVWFPKEEVVSSLEYLTELAQYSPDPTSITWGPFIQHWTGGRVAQGTFLNAWVAGVAAQAGNTEVLQGTDLGPKPNKEGSEYFAPEVPGFDGHTAIKPADNVPGLFQTLIYMYGSIERAAPYYTVADPARFLPAYSGIMESDEFKNGGLYGEFPYLFELQAKCRDELAPLTMSAEEYPDTRNTVYASGFRITSELMNQVIVTGRDPENAYAEARDRLETRLQEAKEKYGV